MIGHPDRTEAAEYFFTYIDKVQTDDILGTLRAQSADFTALLRTVAEDQSLQSYAPGKWTFREALSHINDTERVFSFRLLWVARGAQAPLPGFEQDDFVAAAAPNERHWSSLIDEFLAIRAATLALLESLPDDAWSRRSTINNNSTTARALAYMIAGHVEHHRQIFLEKYL
jgi:hypothetical protein